jgi:hypothetical protein
MVPSRQKKVKTKEGKRCKEVEKTKGLKEVKLFNRLGPTPKSVSCFNCNTLLVRSQVS